MKRKINLIKNGVEKCALPEWKRKWEGRCETVTNPNSERPDAQHEPLEKRNKNEKEERNIF